VRPEGGRDFAILNREGAWMGGKGYPCTLRGRKSGRRDLNPGPHGPEPCIRGARPRVRTGGL